MYFICLFGASKTMAINNWSQTDGNCWRLCNLSLNTMLQPVYGSCAQLRRSVGSCQLAASNSNLKSDCCFCKPLQVHGFYFHWHYDFSAATRTPYSSHCCSFPLYVVANGCKLRTPHTMQLQCKELDKDIATRIDALFPKKECFIEVLPGSVVLPRKYMDIGESIRELPIYPDDVWMISYPRTGSTWAQEMIWLLGNKLDYEGAKQMQQLRSPLIELSALFSEDHHEWVSNSIGNTVDVVRNMARPRFGRSHLPWHLLPKEFDTVKPKIIYTARNPKDLCVSFYYYCKLVHGLNGSFDDFLQLFLEERSPMGSYWKHVLPFWKRSNDPNILFLKYEDMKRNLPKVVRKCAAFLNIDYNLTDEDLRRVCEHLQFDKMQSNPAVNLEPLLKSTAECQNGDESKFIRKGQIGDWRNYITPEMSRRFDEWTEQNSRGSGLTFEYE